MEEIKQRLDSKETQVTSSQLSSDQYTERLYNLEKVKIRFESQQTTLNLKLEDGENRSRLSNVKLKWIPENIARTCPKQYVYLIS